MRIGFKKNPEWLWTISRRYLPEREKCFDLPSWIWDSNFTKRESLWALSLGYNHWPLEVQ